MATAKTKKVKKAHKVSRTPASYRVLAAFGILLIATGLISFLHEQTKFSFTAAPSLSVKAKETSTPTNIYLPSVNVSLPIDEGNIIAGAWQVSATNATHLSSSANPGEKGNIVIYGHNKPSIFGLLTDIKIGDRIVVTTENGIAHFYTVKSINTVLPTHIEFIQPTKTETLTVYTCTGFLDSQRLVVQAELGKGSTAVR